MADADNIWAVAVRVLDALEKQDGDRRRANRFFCEFMKAKSGPSEELVAMISKYVEVIER